VLFRYFAREILVTSLFVLFALLALFGFFDLIKELDDLGRGNYRLTAMLMYVTLTLPSHAYVLLPAAGLMGTLFALARMSEHSEITVMRSSGLSLAQLALNVAGAGVVIALATVLLGELVAPFTEEAAKGLRLKATRSIVAREFRSGFWVKDERSFVNIQDVTPETELLNLKIYDFDPEFRLKAISRAEKGTYAGPNKWTLTNVELTRFEGERAVLERVPTARVELGAHARHPLGAEDRAGADVGREPARLYRAPAREPPEGDALRDRVLAEDRLSARHHRDDGAGDSVRARIHARGRRGRAHRDGDHAGADLPLRRAALLARGAAERLALRSPRRRFRRCSSRPSPSSASAAPRSVRYRDPRPGVRGDLCPRPGQERAGDRDAGLVLAHMPRSQSPSQAHQTPDTRRRTPMAAGDVYAKTERGKAEVAQRKLKLHPRLRTMADPDRGNAARVAREGGRAARSGHPTISSSSSSRCT
jgi:hypothetical protein